jgi:Tol biopolymer transport system component
MRRALLLVVAALAAGCGGHAAIRGPQLVYATATSSDENHEWIWRARPDGTHRVRLVKGRNPQLSPDGRLVAYTRSPHELYVVPISGGKPRLLRRLVGEKAFISGFVWSPTSRELVTVERSLVLVDVETGRARTFATIRSLHLAAVGDPSFSPDGRRIVFDRSDLTGGDLELFDTRSGRVRRLTSDHGSMFPVWGPRGIAFERDGDVWLLGPDRGRVRRLTHTCARIYPAAWSADGKRLLAANPATHNGRLWAVDVRSGRARDLTGWVGDLFPARPEPGWEDDPGRDRLRRDDQPVRRRRDAAVRRRQGPCGREGALPRELERVDVPQTSAAAGSPAGT